jgi:hypothetical protein
MCRTESIGGIRDFVASSGLQYDPLNIQRIYECRSGTEILCICIFSIEALYLSKRVIVSVEGKFFCCDKTADVQTFSAVT